MAHYEDRLTLRDARGRYFALNAFGEGGYDARWVKLKAGPIRLYFPNTESRVRAVRLHDLHHVLTEYDTTWTGEAEIAAWEIASNCRGYFAAWLLNLNAMAIGLVIAPRATYGAFLRGRRTGNLYDRTFREDLLAKGVGETRRELGLDRPRPRGNARDTVAFVAASLAGVVSLVAPLAIVVAGLRAL
jgi:hypothetical protein